MAPPVLPPEWWVLERYGEAFASRHIGVVIRAYRTDPRWRGVYGSAGISQSLVARWACMAQAHVSRTEAGPPEQHLDRLIAWAELLHMPQELLWFDLPERTRRVHRSPAGPGSPLPFSAAPAVPGASPGFGWFAGESAGTVVASVPDRVGLVEVEIIREMTETYRAIDNRHGGGRMRSLVVDFLASSVGGWLRADCPQRGVKDQLFVAAAGLSHLAGWSSYDVGDRDSGGRHLRQAHKLAMAAGDVALSAEMLAGMAHQAAHAWSGALAIDLAVSARDSARRSGVGVLVAEASAMAAHAYAVNRDRPASLAALTDAETTFSASEDAERPSWLAYFDRAYLAAKTGHVLAVLGDFEQAERAARDSLAMADGYDRGKMFNLSLLANILAAQGKIDEAADLAVKAVGLAADLASARSVSYLTSVAARLAPHRAHPGAAMALDRMRTAGISVNPQQS
ncbi:XRE family transcriptional regulator [Kutzneria kofuensis]|uniref:Tetratricopeptide (TPR) repeat protein n=1 Tax=Kutzneria kofuensis TaxID=103725 RepID=A0A7W9KDM3_9PSEU|nr:XRE family transcriptional regulator [Kutzneria kofuensis]MBB5890621.1 tetratricopeptide (TPR) repeat protein [Kutzneria kofuensis]